MSHDDCAKSWRAIALHGLPNEKTSNLDLNRQLCVNPSQSSLQDAFSVFDSKLLTKNQSTHKDKLHMSIDDNEFHISILRACDVLNLSERARDSVSILTICALACQKKRKHNQQINLIMQNMIKIFLMLLLLLKITTNVKSTLFLLKIIMA